MIVLLLIVITITSKIQCECPPSDLLVPCKCSNDEIRCMGNVELNLSHVFGKLHNSTGSFSKHLKLFHLANTFITEIEANVLGEITFETIEIIHCHNLTRIDQNAFTTTNLVTKNINIWDNNE